MTCDDYQIAFDQQRAGVSSAIDAAAFDAHVATCADCTAYVSLSGKVNRTMTDAISNAPTMPDLGAILARVSDAKQKLLRVRTRVPIAVIPTVLLLSLAEKAENGVSVRHVFIALIAAAIGALGSYALGGPIMKWTLGRRMAELQALEASTGEALVTGWRRELDRRIREWRKSWLLYPMLLAVFHLTSVGWRAPYGFYLAFEVISVVLWVWITVRGYRRDVRERAELAR
jgi:hypothetical protein